MRVITFGTFDMFHIGHLNILERARELGDELIVGVSSDALNFSKKGRNPTCSEADRMRIVAALKCVTSVFSEESLELKADYIREHQADILVMGDDWEGKFDNFRELCKVVYLPRTPSISTTELIELVRSTAPTP
jgi:glycerol-3-phosphate cytidylyltransferase